MDFMRKNIEHFSNFISYVIEHLLCIIIVIIILVLAGVILITLPKITPINFESQQILIWGISLENWITWYTGVGLIIGAIWSMYQFTKNVCRKQQEKGASIAKDFSSGLLERCGIVTVVFKKSELYKTLNSRQEYNSFRNFTVSELRDIYGNELPSKYRKLEKECNLDKLYHNILKNRISINENKSQNDELVQLNDEEIRKLFILNNKDLPFHFSSLVDNVLNELESVCMDISSQAAGSKYIYQSLHQIFFRTVKILSVEICLRNDGKYCDKFYTNIIHVYNEWTKRYEKDLKKEKKRKKEVDKILNPKIKTV